MGGACDICDVPLRRSQKRVGALLVFAQKVARKLLAPASNDSDLQHGELPPRTGPCTRSCARQDEQQDLDPL